MASNGSAPPSDAPPPGDAAAQPDDALPGDTPPADGAAPAGTPTVSSPANLTDAFDRLERLLEFPADFPLKVMGRRVDLFAQTVADIVRAHVPSFDPASIDLRPSSKGNWLSVTVVPRVESRAQLEGLYRELSSHPMVKVVL